MTETESAARRLIARAREAQPDWAAQPVAARAEAVGRVRRLLADRVDGMTAALDRPGRTSAESLAAEILPLAEACRFLERSAPRLLRPRRLGTRGRPVLLFGVSAEVRREPFGVILIIGPGNYPLLLTGVQTVQALAAGNAALIKPAPGCSAPMRLLAGWLCECGVPEELVQVLDESPDAAGEAIAAGVDKVVLTGSAESGEKVAEAAGRSLTPSIMELSGSDPVFVLPGADLAIVARALAFGLRFNGSATCIAPRRVFLSREQAHALEEMLADHLADAPAVPLSPERIAELRSLVDDAVAAGARPLGPLPDGSRMRPLIVADARPDMALLKADVGAPLLSLVAVDGPEEALAAARKSPYALGASIFGPGGEAGRFASWVDAGAVTVNDLIAPTADPRLPFGGRHRSGWGVTRGVEGLLEMTQIKTISRRRVPFYRHLDPPSAADEALLRSVFRITHGSRGTRREAVGRLLRTLLKRGQSPTR